MANYKKRLVPIKYTSRDYNSIRSDLIDHAKRYYSDSFKDFSEASFGALMVDSVAYIGDILSFYLDYQANESFLDTSIEYNNILRHGQALGYKFQGRGTTTGIVSLYVIVPAGETGMGIDSRYVPTLRKAATFRSINGQKYTLVADVKFNQPENEIVVARVNEATGVPTHYAIKAFGQVISGEVKAFTTKIGAFERFKKIKIGNANVAEILSVRDAQGNQYYEVDYLSQDVIYKEIVNKNITDEIVPSILKPFTVPRRFAVVRSRASTVLQFGYGSKSELDVQSIADPSDIALDVFGKDYVTDRSFDPSKLLSTDKFGIGPSDTTITIKYRQNPNRNINAGVGAINSVTYANFVYQDPTLLNSRSRSDIAASLEVYNDEPIVGDVRSPNSDEIRERITNTFATQNRAVTKLDYEALAMMMPQKFGLIKRATVIRDPDSTKRNLNMYILSQDASGFLIAANQTIKRNLKTWLGKYKMMTDTVDIIDAKIVNIGINYSIVVKPGLDKFAALAKADRLLRARYLQPYYIGEPFYISEIHSILSKVPDILDVRSVKIVQKRAAQYSDIRFDVDANTSVDGSYITTPKNVALEIKFPGFDIQGTVV